MRIAFAGTPEFAAQALAALHAAGHDIVLVLTQPDRPAGRGQKLQASPVKTLALQHGWPLAQPLSLRLHRPGGPEGQAALQAAQADVLVVAAYGLILPPEVLTMTPLGAINIHASLLPRWRGAAPIHRAIAAGDAETGITLMRMDEGLDTGAMLLWEREPIRPDDTTASLHDRLAALGARLVVQGLPLLAQGLLQDHPQDGALANYAAKIEKSEAWLDWSASAAHTLSGQIRAFDPFPGACLDLSSRLPQVGALKVFAPRVLAVSDLPAAWQAMGAARAGRVIHVGGTAAGSPTAFADDLVIGCVDGALALGGLQRAGGKRLPAAEVLRGLRAQGWVADAPGDDRPC